MEEVKIEFCEKDYIESDNGKLWFVNVGLLNNTAFKNVIEGLKDFNFTDSEIIKIIALSAMYLTSDLELIAHRVTPLIRDCLEKRFTFVVKLGEIHVTVNYFFRSSFISTLMSIFDCMEELTKEPYADIDILNPIAKALVYLEALTFDIRQNPWLDRWLKINGYSCNKFGVHYHCFMIPIHPNTYIKQFTRKDDETFLEKIEYYCFCKLQLSENVACFYRNEYYLVECIFDVYKGRYLGLLDMLQFISKSLNPTKYEIKHILTLAKTGEDRFESINSFDKDTLLALANSLPADNKPQQIEMTNSRIEQNFNNARNSTSRCSTIPWQKHNRRSPVSDKTDHRTRTSCGHYPTRHTASLFHRTNYNCRSGRRSNQSKLL